MYCTLDEFNKLTCNKNETRTDMMMNSFLLLQENKNRKKILSQNNSLYGSKLQEIFFSKQNIKRIQRMIKDEVFKRTKGKFKMEVDQDEEKLLIIMKSCFEEHASVNGNDVIRKTKMLNNIVIQRIMPTMISSIQQYYGYLEKIYSPLQPMMLPLNVSGKGRKISKSITTIWQ